MNLFDESVSPADRPPCVPGRQLRAPGQRRSMSWCHAAPRRGNSPRRSGYIKRPA